MDWGQKLTDMMIYTMIKRFQQVGNFTRVRLRGEEEEREGGGGAREKGMDRFDRHDDLRYTQATFNKWGTLPGQACCGGLGRETRTDRFDRHDDLHYIQAIFN